MTPPGAAGRTVPHQPHPSPFAVRGVIEGFYGPPWTAAQRRDMVEFIAERGMNTFLYSPKDDPFLRHQWREPYDEARLAAIAELHAHGRARGVTVVPGLSPGLSMRYSSDADRAQLIAKFRTLLIAGITHVALLLDDIPPRLQHPEDHQRFATIAEAHADVVNAVCTSMGEEATLLVCPLQYWGRGDEPYITEFGRKTLPQVQILWTGSAICSSTLDLRDAAQISRTLHRPVTYWDNYPVNDVAMTGELHVGPYQGRDADLGRFSNGILANAMEHAESSKIALATIADYLADPHAYEPERSWAAAIDAVAGPYADAYRLFADNCRASCLSADHAPMTTRAIEDLLFGLDYLDRQRSIDEYRRYLSRLDEAAAHLRGGIEAGHPLLVEARPWIDAFTTGIQALEAIGDAVTGHPDRARLTDLRERLRGNGLRIFGDVLTMTLDDVLRTTAHTDATSTDATSTDALTDPDVQP